MTTQEEWKALCAELVNAWLEGRDIAGPMNRARAELAKPEPQGPTDEELTNQEIEEWADAAAEVPLEELDPEVHGWRRCFSSEEFCETIRAALTRWGRPAIEPEPQGLTVEELMELVSRICGLPADCTYAMDGGRFSIEPGEIVAFARAVARRSRPTFDPQGPTDEEWDALKERLWGKYETIGYQGERFMYEGDFCTALDLARQELARFGRPAIKPVPQSENCPGCEGTPAANNSPCAVCGQLAQPEPQGATQAELDGRFYRWWHNKGSGMSPLPGEDQEEHAHRISRIAWHNGAYVERWCRHAIKPVPPAMNDDFWESWDIRSVDGSFCFASAIYARLVGGEHDESEVLWLAEYLRANSAIKPVPVAERLPGPEDFHPENDWCWGWYDWRWRMMDSTCFYRGCKASHYAPYWALPVPTAP